MSLNRRDFLKLMGGSAAAFSFAGVMFQGCKKAVKKAAEDYFLKNYQFPRNCYEILFCVCAHCVASIDEY